jgi:hypothetical protein
MKTLLTLSIFFALTHVTPSKAASVYRDPKTGAIFAGRSTNALIQGSGGPSTEVSLDDNTFTVYVNEVRFPTEGKHHVAFRIRAVSGQWSYTEPEEVYSDQTPPETHVDLGHVIEARARRFLSPTGVIVLSATDNLSGVAKTEYSWDEIQWSAYSAPVTLTDKSGSKTFYYRSKDNVGNVEPTHRIDFVVDATPPVSSYQLLPESKSRSVTLAGKIYRTINDSTKLVFSARDGGSEINVIWVSVDGKPFIEYKNPLFLLSGGPHEIRYYADDKVGNKEEVRSISLYTESATPQTTASILGNSFSMDGVTYARPGSQLKLEARSGLAGVDKIEVEESDGFRPYTQPISLDAVGVHEFKFRASDRAGNTEPIQTFKITVVVGKPETHIVPNRPVSNHEGVFYSPSPNLFRMEATSPVVGVKEILISLDGQSFKPYTGPFTLEGENKTFKITFKSVDNLGFEEKPQTIVYEVRKAGSLANLFPLKGKSDEEKLHEQYFQASPLLAPLPK